MPEQNTKLSTHRYYLMAYPVSDLTVARYLSAMGVDFLGVDADSFSAEKLEALLNTLSAWLAGPEIVLFGSSEHPPAYLADRFKYFEKPAGEIPDLTVHQSSLQIAKLSQNIFKEVMLDPLKLPESCMGYFFHPGTENAPGIYDSELTDRFFEAIS